MSSEVHKYIEEALENNKNLINAEVISFPYDKKTNISKNLSLNSIKTWKLYDNSDAREDGDQLRAVLGICFMFITLIVMGIYSNLT
tara:strand:- start:752 stop:1009 length:258 start_codon:yes stop_codon:yes gene_type:complete